MSNGPAWNAHDWLDHYLDGLLGEADRARFEEAMARDPRLREAVEMQRRIDGELRRGFAPDVGGVAAGVVGARAAVKGTAGTPQARGGQRQSWTRLAAMIVLALGLAAVLFARRSEPSWESPAKAYAKEIDAGFRPYMVCTTDEEFAAFTEQRLGRAVVLAAAPGVTPLGWNYNSRVLSENTVSLLVDAGGDRIVVYMDRGEFDRAIEIKGTQKPRVFRKNMCGAVFYEVTPRDEPVVLPLLSKRKP